MVRVFHGIVHGNMVHLNENPGIQNGLEVEVVLSLPTRETRPWGEGILRSAGAASVEDVEAVFRQVEADRKAAEFRETTE